MAAAARSSIIWAAMNLHGYIPAAISGDDNLYDYYQQYPRFNPDRIENIFQIAEDPQHPGAYYGVDAPEFGTHAVRPDHQLDGSD